MKIHINRYGSYYLAGLLITVCLSLLGYHFRPTQMCDIHNYWFYLESYMDSTFWEGINRQMFPYGYGFNIWFWLIAQTRNRFLLSASSCLMVYGIYMYIWADFCREYAVRWIDYGVGIVFILGNASFYQIASSMRNFVAVAICSLAMYWERKHQWLSVALWIIAAFVHNSILIFAICYLLYRLFYLRNKKRFFVLLLAFMIVGMYMLYSKENMSINAMIVKYSEYLMIFRRSFSSTFYYMTKKLYMYAVLFFGWILVMKRAHQQEKNTKEAFYYFLTVEIILLVIPDNIYSRVYQSAILFLIMSLMGNTWKTLDIEDKTVRRAWLLGSGIACTGWEVFLLLHVL